MNKELCTLAAQGLLRRRKNSLLLFAVLFLSFAFSVASLAVTGTMAKTNEEYLLDTYGAWMGAIVDGSKKDEEFLREAEWLDTLGVSRSAGTFANNVSIGTADEGFFEMSRFTMQSGRMPRAADEIAIEANTLDYLGYDPEPGQTITLTVSFSANYNQTVEVEMDFKLCGVLRAYSNVWSVWSRLGYSVLNSAFVTEDGFQRLRDAGEEGAEAIRQEALDMEAAGKGKSALKSLSLGYIQTHYFFTFTDTAENVQQDIQEHYSGGKGAPLSASRSTRNHILFNYSAYGESMDPYVTTADADRDYSAALIYSGLIFVSVLLAVFCIYAVQIQKQVRHFALFRSIGITRRQLRKMVLFETLMLCVPAAALGAAGGTLGAFGIFVVLGMANTAALKITVPWRLLAPLALAWVLGVLLTRLLILGMALREPLTGRISSDIRKQRRYRRLRIVMAGALAVLLCGSLIFTVAESLPPMHQLSVEKAKPSYDIQASTGTIRTEDMDQWEEILGVTGMRVLGELYPNMTFDGAQDAQAFRDVTARLADGDDVTGGGSGVEPAEIDGKAAIGVALYVLPDDDPDSFLDLSGTGMDMEAFRRGELVAVSFPQEPDGSYYMDSVVYKQVLERHVSLTGDDTVVEQEYTAHRDASDTGLRPGSSVTLEFMTSDVEMTVDYAMEEMGYTMEDFAEMGYFEGQILSYQTVGEQITTPPISAAVLRPTVGAVVPVPSGTDISFLGLDEHVYVFWCSETFAQKVLDSADPRLSETVTKIGPYTIGAIGNEFGFTRAEVFTDDITGRYTDIMMEIACYRAGADISLHREENAAKAQEHIQTLILLISSGGCITLLLLLVLGNTLVMESERLKKNYGIMQALGMSRRQLQQKLAVSALKRGLAGAAFGWLVWCGYAAGRAAMLYIGQKDAPKVLRYGPAQALKETLWRYMYAGAGAGTAVGLTVIAAALVAATFLFANRGLFRENLMDKLREE